VITATAISDRLGVRRTVLGTITPEAVDRVLGKCYTMAIGLDRVEVLASAVDPQRGLVTLRIITPRVGPVRQDVAWDAFTAGVQAGTLEEV
jgi:hypothetical protein